MLLAPDAMTKSPEELRLAARVKDLEEQVRILEGQVDEYQNLFVTSSQLITPVSPQEVLAVIQEVLFNLVGAQSFDISLRNDRQQLVSIVTGETEGPTSAEDVSAWRELQSSVLASGQAVYPKTEPLMAIVPLYSAGTCMGVLSIFHLLPQKNNVITEVDVGMLDFLSQHGARAFELATDFEQHTAAIAECIKVLSAARLR